MVDQTRDGAGDADIIPFPVDRVSPPELPAASTEPGEFRGGADSAEPAGELLSVDDLRQKILTIESSESPSGVEAVDIPSKQRRKAKNIALHQLGVSGRSEAEVRERLAAREIDQEVIDQEVAKLTEVGLIDDAALAATLVAGLRERKKLGSRAIGQALRRRKIPTEVIEEALAAADGHDDDVAVFDVARERARSLRHLDRDVAFRRVVGFVQRRGYSGPQVFEAARRAVDEASEVS